MKREAGASAGILALLALVIHTQYPAGHEAAGSNRAGAPATHSPAAPVRPDGDGREHKEGPWIATRAFFQQGEPDVKLDVPCPLEPDWSTSCLTAADGQVDYHRIRRLMGLPDGPLNKSGRWSIVASIADPLHTRLSLAADRQVESIQRALQADDWQLAGQWLPWEDHFDSSESDISERWRQRRLQRDQEQMPGVLVFRRFRSTEQSVTSPSVDSGGAGKREILLLFLVPDTPTSGIPGPPFFSAMQFAAAFTEPDSHDTKDNRIGILMPSFSGSFSSLTALVQAWNKMVLPAPWARIAGPVYGGSISSTYQAKIFTERTGLEFRSGIASTADYEKVFCEVLARYRIEGHEAAYLVEDETAYAQVYNHPETQVYRSLKKRKPETACSDKESEWIPSYVFPRDISHLRNIYQDDTESTAPDRNQRSAQGVNFSIKDPNRGEDSVPTFSEAQTPLSQSAVVASIIEEFRRRRTRLVYIVGTNVLDSLFLARLIRHEAPDTRVLSDDPDVLFVSAAAQDHPLTGIIALSTYPMFFEGDEWLTEGGERYQRLPFTSPDVEGLYNVTRTLLARTGAALPAPSGAHNDRLRAYHQLQNGQSHPGLWLLTLSQTGFHPVDLLDEQQGPAGDPVHARWFAHDRPAVSQPVSPPEASFLFPAPSRGWFLASGTVSGFAFMACFLVLWANTGRSLQPHVWLALGHGVITPRLLAMAGSAFAFNALAWILFLPVCLSHFEEPHSWLIGVTAMGVCGLVLPLATLLFLWWWHRSRTSDLRSRFYFALMAGLWLLVVSAWGWSCVWLTPPASLLFRFRALDLFSGASPALPFLILGTVAVSGFAFYLKRFAHAGLCRPCLYLRELGAIPLNSSYRAVNRHIMAPAHLKNGEWSRRMVLSAATLGVCLPVLQLTKNAGAFENPLYNWALACAVAILLFSLATTCYDLVLISKSLERLLSLIDFMLLRDSFEQITRDLPHRPIWSQRPSKHLITKKMLIALHNRRLVRGDAEATADFEKFRDAMPVILERNGRPQFIEAAMQLPLEPHMASLGTGAAVAVSRARTVPAERREPTVEDFIKKRHAYEKLCARLAAGIVKKDLLKLWKQDIAEPSRGYRASSPAEQHDLDLRRFCGDFVALQFSRYLIYVVSQVRLIAWCLSFALLMLMVTLNSYSPQAPQLIGRFLAILFVALGAITFRIFAKMERDPILSRIAGNKPGQLNQGFWVQVLAMGILPLAGVICHLFPTVSGYFYSWLVPGVEALH